MDEQRDVTRGFLFADLRGYTAFVERRGDAAAASLLRAYRDLVRRAISPFAGAEVRTEGDSFYLTFPSASRAVAAALAIVAAAAEATANDPSLPIEVGVGVHAGETQSTDEGPVGSAVNIAARLAAQAGPGEVLVTETVRGLTRTSGTVRYVARGTPRLKGIDEPVPVYAALGATDALAPPYRRRRLSSTTATGLVALVALVALVTVGSYALMGGIVPAPAASATATASSAAIASAVPPTGSPPGSSQPSSAPFSLTPARWPESSRVDLVPGRYRAVDFRPPFEITLDEGWQFRVDSADLGYIHLQLASRPSSGLTFVRLDKLPTDACALEPTATVTDVGSVTTWLRSQPGLDAGASVTRSFATTGAIQMDLAAHDEGACEFSTPRYVAIRPHESSATCCTGFQLNVGEVATAYLFGSEVVVGAFAVAPTQSEAAILIPKVDPVLQGIAFDWP